jgi:hypothetical protein
MPAYAITIEVATTLLLAVRLTSRVNRIGAGVGMDDVLILFAWLFGLSSTVLIIYCGFYVDPAWEAACLPSHSDL